MSVPAFLQRRQRRDPDMVAAAVVALVAELGGRAYTDRVAHDLGLGMGRVIAARDRLTRDGWVERDGDEIVLTAKALRELIQPDEPEAA